MSVVLDFKTRVASFMSRNSSDFVSGSADQLLSAINDARRAAQREYEFQRLLTEGFVTTSILGVDITSAVKTAPAGVTVLSVRNIKKVWTYTTRAISAGTYYERTGQVDYRTRRELTTNIPLAGTGVLPTMDNRSTDTYTGRTIGYMKGSKFYVNVEANTEYLVDVIQWLPNLVDGDGADFFLTYAEDWLLFKTVQILNGYIKEDQRVAISQSAMAKAWESLTNFDADVAGSNDWNDLD